MRAKAYLCIGVILFATLSVVFAEECQIIAVKHRILEAGTIGYSGAPSEKHRVTIVELEVRNKSDREVKLNWKNSVPTLTAGGRQVKAVRLLVPNWLPFAGGATETMFGGEEIKGFLEIDKDTWCGWLAIDEPGSISGDHISIPIESVTVTVTKEKPVKLKFLFPDEVVFAQAALVVPGCS